ncbi:MAG: hypothetical protein JW953_20370 [Anaerolineae bacterium]|nr:hypothetical protein [Anaerolineae bacterium]
MSEYQYYEFRAMDRPLTEEEQVAVGKLSSRVDLSPTHAIFVYNYSDFPARAEEILDKYFDAMLYMANWGSCQLMFRFPQNMIDLEQVKAYCVPAIIDEFISFTKKGDYVVLNIEWHEEEAEWGWIEGEGWLPRLMGLRDDILRGDYRLLYLAWLKAITLDEEILDEVEEPPVPAGLRQLSAELRTFVELFELDEHLVAAAAEASGSPKNVSEAQLRQAIGQLSTETRETWLLRLAQGEPQLSVAFNRELLKLMEQPQQAPLSRRTIGDLFAATDRMQKEAQDKRAAEARARHLKKMESLAAQESRLWQDVINLIEQKSGKSYDQAVVHLLDLRDLAQYQEQQSVFQSRLNKVYQDCRHLSGLLRRLRNAKLYDL